VTLRSQARGSRAALRLCARMLYSRVVSYNWTHTQDGLQNGMVDASGIRTIDRYRSLAVSGNTGSLHTGPITFFNIGKGFARYGGIWQPLPDEDLYRSAISQFQIYNFFIIETYILSMAKRANMRARPRGCVSSSLFLSLPLSLSLSLSLSFSLFFLCRLIARRISGDVIYGIHSPGVVSVSLYRLPAR